MHGLNIRVDFAKAKNLLLTDPIESEDQLCCLVTGAAVGLGMADYKKGLSDRAWAAQ